MTIDQIRYFLALSERLNFRAVADRFFITQPTLSRQIANMERELGTRLFVRTNTSVELTPAGKTMYEGMRGVYHQYETVVSQVREVDACQNGRLFVAVAEDQMMSSAVLKSIQLFTKQYPQIHVSVQRVSMAEIRNGLLTNQYDVANALYLDGIYLRGLECRVLVQEAACLAISKELAQRYPQRLTSRELEEIMHTKRLHLLAHEYFVTPSNPVLQLQKNFHVEVAEQDLHFIGSLTSLPLQVGTGLCATIVNRSHVISSEPNIAMLELPEAQPYTKVVAYHGSANNPALEQFLGLLAQVQETEMCE